MKNVFFALAFMLIGSFTFANNFVKNESFDSYSIEESESSKNLVGTCYVTVTTYDENGYVTSEHTYVFENVASETACNQIASSIRKLLSISSF